MRRSLSTILALSLVFLLAGCGESPEQKSATQWETAHHQLATFQFDAARQTFEQIATERPNEPIGLYADAAVLEHQMQFWNAMPVYMQIVADQPTFEPARAALWRSMAWNGYTQDAVDVASDWLAAFPSSTPAATALAESLIDDQQYGRATTAIDSAVSLGLHPATAAMMRAVAYRQQYKFDSAAAAAATQGPAPTDDPQYYRWAAEYFEEDNQYDSSHALSRTAYELAGTNWNHWWRHFHRMLRLDDRHGARRMIDEFAQSERPEPIISWLRLKYYQAIGEYHKAKRDGVLYTRSYQQDISTLFTEMIFTRDAHDQLSAEGNAKAIDGLLQQASYPERFNNLMSADVLYQLKDDRPGLEYLKLIDGIAADYRGRLGFVTTRLKHLHSTGQLDAYAEMRRKLLSEHGDEADWLTGIADVMAHPSVKEFDRAYDVYLDALAADRWYYPAFEHTVNLMLWRGRPAEAAKLFELYPYFVDTLPQAALLHARVKVYNDQIDDALTLLRDHVEPIRMVVHNYVLLDSVMHINNHHDARLRLADAIVDIAPDNPDVLAVAAEIAVETGNWDRALEIADQALAIDTTLVSPAVTKAWATFNKGEKAAAFEMFVNNSVAERNDTRNNMYYSLALAKEGREPDRAGNLARMAVFESLGELETRLNLSQVYYLLGRFDLSYGEAYKAAKLEPNSAKAWFRVGVAQYELGRGDAIENLRQAVNLGLHGEDLATARRILGN